MQVPVFKYSEPFLILQPVQRTTPPEGTQSLRASTINIYEPPSHQRTPLYYGENYVTEMYVHVRESLLFTCTV